MGDGAHITQSQALQPASYARADAPEVRERLMVPERLPEGLLIERADAVRRVLRLDIEGNLREVEVRADAAGGGEAETALDFPQQELSRFTRRPLVDHAIACEIDEGLVDGIDKDILLAEIVQVEAVDLSGVVEIELHARRGRDVVQMRRNLEQAAAVADALGLERWGDREADRPAAALLVRHDQVGGHRIESAHDALARRVKRLQIDDEIAALCHNDTSFCSDCLCLTSL